VAAGGRLPAGALAIARTMPSSLQRRLAFLRLARIFGVYREVVVRQHKRAWWRPVACKAPSTLSSLKKGCCHEETHIQAKAGCFLSCSGNGGSHGKLHCDRKQCFLPIRPVIYTSAAGRYACWTFAHACATQNIDVVGYAPNSDKFPDAFYISSPQSMRQGSLAHTESQGTQHCSRGTKACLQGSSGPNYATHAAQIGGAL
jgi:hypothetical protein